MEWLVSWFTKYLLIGNLNSTRICISLVLKYELLILYKKKKTLHNVLTNFTWQYYFHYYHHFMWDFFVIPCIKFSAFSFTFSLGSFSYKKLELLYVIWTNLGLTSPVPFNFENNVQGHPALNYTKGTA